MLVRAIERPKHRSLTVAAPFEAYSRSESVMLSTLAIGVSFALPGLCEEICHAGPRDREAKAPLPDGRGSV
jgi:hypothetical protein